MTRIVSAGVDGRSGTCDSRPATPRGAVDVNNIAAGRKRRKEGAALNGRMVRAIAMCLASMCVGGLGDDASTLGTGPLGIKGYRNDWTGRYPNADPVTAWDLEKGINVLWKLPTHGSGAALLTLVERKHRQVIIRKLPDKTQASVLKALKGIERHYGPKHFRQIFKSITVDNGSEFLDFEALEASGFDSTHRTRVFYAHPYSAWERGSNENANRMIRRFVAKGHDIARLTQQAVASVETWINNYPRRILGFMAPNDLFNNELKAVA
jgi:hypothetical protein